MKKYRRSIAKKQLWLFMISAFMVCISFHVFAQKSVFRAGASIVNITPSLGKSIVGGFTPIPSTHIHDEINARCIVLDDGMTKLVFVVADNVGITREVFDEAKRLILTETQIKGDHILMSSTHTHSSVSAASDGQKRGGWNYEKPLDEYQTFIARRMADGVRVALNNLQPARIGWGVGNMPQHLFNRRWKVKSTVTNPFGKQDQVMMNPGHNNPNIIEPAGPVDPGLSFLSIQNLEGRPIAILANYSLHYVGGVPAGHISADYFAVFANRLQELLKTDSQDPPFVAMMSNGTSGDVNNINFGGPGEKYPPYEKMSLVANDLAQEVIRVYQTISYQNWVPLRAAQSELSLKVRKPSPQMLEYARNVLKKTDKETKAHPLEKIYAGRTIQLQEWPENINIILQAFRIGELGIAAIPFEVFTEIGLEIKDTSPFKPSFTMELANGSYGYLPTPEQHQLGGYETWLGTNRVETEASRKIVSEILKLFNQVKL